jgi:hypothetical protein
MIPEITAIAPPQEMSIAPTTVEDYWQTRGVICWVVEYVLHTAHGNRIGGAVDQSGDVNKHFFS